MDQVEETQSVVSSAKLAITRPDGVIWGLTLVETGTLFVEVSIDPKRSVATASSSVRISDIDDFIAYLEHLRDRFRAGFFERVGDEEGK